MGTPRSARPHGDVFGFLDEAGTRVSELAARAQVTRPSMAELVAHPECHGYLQRGPDPADGRAVLVRATARGREVHATAHAALADIERDWTALLGGSKMRRLRRLLGELNEALAAREAGT